MTKIHNIIIFDCDSTLTTIEGLDTLAHLKGIERKVAAITQKAMNGEVDFETALAMRLKLLAPTEQDILWLGNQYILNETKNAQKTIAQFSCKGFTPYIVSGGLQKACEIFGIHLGIKKENIFGEILDKKATIKAILDANLAKNAKYFSVFVGDGANDLAAKDIVDYFIGFGGVKIRAVVKQKSECYIETEDLQYVFDEVIKLY